MSGLGLSPLPSPEHRLRYEHKSRSSSICVFRGHAFEGVLTGHGSGLITVNVAEADDERREQIRLALSRIARFSVISAMKSGITSLIA
jgi:hypothetical protein